MHTADKDIPPISKKHFLRSLNNVRPSVPQHSIAQFFEWNDKYGSQVRLHVSALPESMRPEITDMPKSPIHEEKKEKNDDDDDDNKQEEIEEEKIKPNVVQMVSSLLKTKKIKN